MARAVLLLVAALAAVAVAGNVFPFPTARDIQLCPMDVDGHMALREISKTLLLDAPKRASCSSHIQVHDGEVAFVVRTAGRHLDAVAAYAPSWFLLDEAKTYWIAAVEEAGVAKFTRAMEGFEFRVIRSPSARRAIAPLSVRSLTAAQLATKEEIVDSVSASEYDAILSAISGDSDLIVGGEAHDISTRYTGTDENYLAAQYMLDYLNDLGYEASFQEFRYQSQTARNVIGIKRGTSSDIVVIGAHMDSTSPQASTNAPGAIDNGSGSVGVLLAAKAFADVNTTSTIHFLLFGVEEQGLIGSEYYVSQLDANRYDVTNALIMDMIGYSNRYVGVMIEGVPFAEELMDVMAENVDEFAPDLTWTSRRFSFGSDHVSFQDANIPAFLAIEQDETDYPGYHQTSDTVAYLHTGQAVGITRAMVGSLYDLAI